MQKTIPLLAAAFFVSTPLSAQTKVASWKLQKDAGVPDAMYVAFPPQLVLCVRNGSYFMRRIWNDGSSGSTQVEEQTVQGGRRFGIPSNPSGEFYLWRDNGILQYLDEEGVVYTAAPAGEQGSCS